MAVETIIGTRLRERRRQIGITQAELARRLNISASYLNLIERNKRRIAGPLLRRAASQLGLSADELDGAQQKRLLETLQTISQAPVLKSSGIERDATTDLVARYPGWARGIVALARAEETAQATAQALSDQLAHDPFLGEAVHTMLTRIAAVRSASEILTDFADVTVDERRRFNRIVADEARVLTEVGEALASYFDKSLEAERTLTPRDEVDATFRTRANRFPEIEGAAEEIASRLEPGTPEQRWRAARGLATGLLQLQIDTVIAAEDAITTEAGRNRAERALMDYAAAAIVMPGGRFSREAGECHYDVEQLARVFNASISAVCRRLTALDTARHPQFGYLSANAAGSILELLPHEDLPLPRHGFGCPLWILFRAASDPGVLRAQSAVFPGGARFVFIGHARRVGRAKFRQPRHFVTDMLVVSAAESTRTLYASTETDTVEEVGPGCRLCPRRDCAHRVEDPLLG